MIRARGFPASDGTRWSSKTDANVRTYCHSASIKDIIALGEGISSTSIAQRCALWHIAKKIASL